MQGTISKEAKAAVKANCQAMAYLEMALMHMELLHLFTRAVTTEWPEGYAWKVMMKVQDIYRPNYLQLIAERRFKLASIRMGMDNPSILFCKLTTLEHAYSNTQGHLTSNVMIFWCNLFNCS